MKIIRWITSSVISLFAKRAVGARILLIENNKILLVKHTYTKGWYSIGGAVDKGETPFAAIHRELKEEVGVTLKETPKIFSVYLRDNDKYDDYIILFVASTYEMQPCKSLEIAQMQWFAFDELPEDVTPATKRRIDEYLGQREISDKW